MLTLGIRYLNGFVAASQPDDLERAEWPPHPGRVFMALAAAHFQTGADAKEREALIWLEELGECGQPLAPHLVAADPAERAVVVHFVPVNDDNAGFAKKLGKTKPFPQIGQTGLRRNRQERTFARAWLNPDTVYLTWPGVEPDDEVRSALAALCAKVTRIGHAVSMVQMWLAADDEPGDPTWIPDEDRAQIYLRLAPRGTLDDLERRFNARAVEEFAAIAVAAADALNTTVRKSARKKLREEYADGPPVRRRPNLSVSQGYARPSAVTGGTQVAGTVFNPHLIALRIEYEHGPYRQLDLACTLAVTSRWREALLSQGNDLPNTVRHVLSGHDVTGASLDEPHVAFAPLAFVGHDHADGRLLGMGIAVPRDLEPADRRGMLRALGRVRQIKLGRLGVWRLDSATETPPRNIQSAAWTGHPSGATQWSTVTPVVFDRHPKSTERAARREEVADILRRSCVRVGVTEPREVIVTAISAHPGVPPAHAFPRLHRKDGSPRRHTHAILVFNEPVCGPILLGAGRYRGYGFCRPLGNTYAGRRTS